MSPRSVGAFLLFVLCLGCGDSSGVFRPPVRVQRLPSGGTVQVTSCLLVWGADHDERHPDEDSFALEYVSARLTSSPHDLDREALEVFELIRPISEQWGFSTASLSAFPSVERTGRYEVYNFSRAAGGTWSFTRHSAKVFNTESGRRE